jgi:hypothetical protein
MNSISILKRLGLLGVILTAISLATINYQWLSATFLNIGTGIVSSVILIYLYDLFLEKQRDKTRNEKQCRAIKNQKVVLRQHYRVLLDCYRSSYTKNQPPIFHDINEFLGYQYADVVKNLDVYAPSPMNSDGSVPYHQYIESSFKQLTDSLQSLLSNTGDSLDIEVFTAIDNVLNSNFLKTCLSLNSLCSLNIPEFGRPPSALVMGMTDHINDYCIKYSQLINAFEKIEQQGLREYNIEDWHNLIFPIGHARLANA